MRARRGSRLRGWGGGGGCGDGRGLGAIPAPKIFLVSALKSLTRGAGAFARLCAQMKMASDAKCPHPSDDMNVTVRPLPACGCRRSRQPRETRILVLRE